MITHAHSRPELARDESCHARRHPLDAIFSPRTVAVIGATEREGSVGCAVLRNLCSFDGTVYPVNPKRASVLGIQALPSLAAVPEKVDLAVIVTPAPTVPGIIRECVDAGVPGAIVLSAGFKECGPGGAALERQILLEARRGPLRVIGPNCLGLMSPHKGLNATFAASMARAGGVAFISQSGALCTAILDWSLHDNVGFSAFVSVGSMLDVGWGDLIYYLGDDPCTRSIVCYMESAGDARSFLSAAREVALTKPIIVIKVGHTEAAARAAASHTGALTGSDEVLDAAFRRAGVLRVNAVEELFDMAEVLAKQPRPTGPRLAIVTNAGGPGALAADMLVSSGGQLAALSESTRTALDALLPPHWSHGNPIDILGDATPEHYARAVELAAKDPNNDGVLVILTPQAMTDATTTAERLKPLARLEGKPILASWMGGPAVATGEAILNSVGIPTFRYPDRAARAFDLMWRYSENLRALYETPTLAVQPAAAGPGRLTFCSADNAPEPDHAGGCKQKAEAILSAVHKTGRTILTEFESKQILAAYGIPTVETRIALSEDEAVQHARKMGYPVVVKLFSETLTHKTDVGGVQLDLRNAGAVRRAWRQIKQSVQEKMGSAAAPAAATGAPPVARADAGALGEGGERATQDTSGASCHSRKSSSPSPREERAGRGASNGMGLLSPALSSCRGGEGADLLRPLGGCDKMGPDPGAPRHFLGVTVQPMIPLDGYELILGSSVDSQFGPVLLFGAGGSLVEVFKDRALGLPPLNATLARRLMERTRIYTALRGVRGRRPADLPALEQLLVCFSQLVAEQPWIKEIDLNPLFVSSERMVVLDARMVLHGRDLSEDRLPRLAIRPYPAGYVMNWRLKDGTAVVIRPIRPEDEPLMIKFHETLSERSVYYRYFAPLRLEQRIAHKRLARLCFIDYDREMALVVERSGERNREILGVGRLSKLHGANEAEFALIISDRWQNQGLGTQLLKRLVQVGRDEKLERITATILPDNREMQQVARKAGFQIRRVPGEPECQAELGL